MLPVKYQKLFRQCTFGLKQHPFAATYLDADRAKLFDKIFSPHSHQLYQQEGQASSHSLAKVPLFINKIANSDGTKDLKALTEYDLRAYQNAFLLLKGKKIWNFQSNGLRKVSNNIRTYLFFLRIVMLTVASVCFLPFL